jgi:hypothetical protein
MLPHIRKHLDINGHHQGSSVNWAMTERLPEHERDTISVLPEKNALMGYYPEITIADAVIVINDTHLVAKCLCSEHFLSKISSRSIAVINHPINQSITLRREVI